MSSDKFLPIFEWDTEESKLSASAKQYAKDVLGETDAKREEGFRRLRLYLAKANHIEKCYIGPIFLQFMLRKCKYNISKAEKRMDRAFVDIQRFQDNLRSISVNDSTFNHMLDRGLIYPLLETDSNGRMIIVINADVATTTDLLKYSLKVGLTFLLLNQFYQTESTVKGMTIIVTMTDPSFWLTLPVVEAAEILMTISIYGKGEIKQLDLVGSSSIFPTQFISTIVKFGASSKLAKKMHFHNDFSTIEKSGIPLSALPKQYGGTIELKTITESFKKKLNSLPPNIFNILDELRVSEEYMKKVKPNTPRSLALVLPVIDRLRKLILSTHAFSIKDRETIQQLQEHISAANNS